MTSRLSLISRFVLCYVNWLTDGFIGWLKIFGCVVVLILRSKMRIHYAWNELSIWGSLLLIILLCLI